ncbi:MAG: type II toxin-antitoxin system death-on-curing family toxin [Cyanobacteriota bacterium]
MRWLQLGELLELHQRLLAQSGGTPGLRDLGLLEASMALPRQSFNGADLYPGLIAKAAALGFLLIQNHPFIDGNKRIGHAALEITLLLNGLELTADVDAAEAAVLAVASGAMDRQTFTRWVAESHQPLSVS